MSGKYVGALAAAIVLPAMAVVAWRGINAGNVSAPEDEAKGRRAWRTPFVFPLLAFAACIAVVVLVNAKAFQEPDRFLAGFSRETEGATSGHKGIRRKVPHAEYLGQLQFGQPIVTWAFFLAFLVILARGRSYRVGLSLWALFVFAAIFLALISCSPKLSPRYLLPVKVCLSLMVGLGAAGLWRLARSGKGSVGWVALLVLGLASYSSAEARDLLQLRSGFSHNARNTMWEWIEQELDPRAVLLQVHPRYVPDPKMPGAEAVPERLKQRIVTDRDADTKGIEAARAEGITHFVGSSKDFGVYLKANLETTEAAAEASLARRAFYEQLVREGELVWSAPAGPIGEIGPPLLIYRLPPARSETGH